MDHRSGPQYEIRTSDQDFAGQLVDADIFGSILGVSTDLARDPLASVGVERIIGYHR